MIGTTSALAKYKDLALKLQAKHKITDKEALEILEARNTLHYVLDENKKIPQNVLLEIKNLDDVLRKYGYRIAAVLDLKNHQKAAPKNLDYWWWDAEELSKQHPLDTFDFLIKPLSIGAWSVCLGLLAAIITRFFSTSPDILGGITISLSTLVTVSKAKTDFTQAGKESLKEMLTKLKIPIYLHEEFKLGLTLILVGCFSLLWFRLPEISMWYLEQGQDDFRKNQVGDAISNHKRAIAIDDNNTRAYQSLGFLYEQIQQYEDAKEYYRKSLFSSGGLDLANPDEKNIYLLNYNNLGRMFIFDEQYEEAALILEKGLSMSSTTDLVGRGWVEYALNSHLGYVRYQLEQYKFAHKNSRVAISLLENYPVLKRQSGLSLGLPYCVMSQVSVKLDPDMETYYSCRCSQLSQPLNRLESEFLYQILEESSADTCFEVPGQSVDSDYDDSVEDLRNYGMPPFLRDSAPSR